jgi:hypothetical protein
MFEIKERTRTRPLPEASRAVILAINQSALRSSVQAPSAGQSPRKGKLGNALRNNESVKIAPVKPLDVSVNHYKIVTDRSAEEKFLRAFKSLLNKLTPEKFDSIVKQARALGDPSVGLLKLMAESL